MTRRRPRVPRSARIDVAARHESTQSLGGLLRWLAVLGVFSGMARNLDREVNHVFRE